MTRFKCAMISRVEVEVEIPDGTYYNHSVLDKAIKERYGDKLADMMAEKVHMEHFTRVRE
jgi:hypothetical protein